jgi:hypothetical protein
MPDENTAADYLSEWVQSRERKWLRGDYNMEVLIIT